MEDSTTDRALRPGGRVALFGGSFDPPHRGHLAVARAAARTFALQSVIFSPTGRQPLKPNGASAPFKDRVAMVSLACEHDPGFAVSRIDAPRVNGRPNYTVDTLDRLRSLYPAQQLFAIAGADSFLDLPRWFQSHRLLELAEWIVVSRPGFDLAQLGRLDLLKMFTDRVHVLDTLHEPVSASQLRARLAQGEDCSDSIQQNVLGYIQEHHLYR